MKLTFLGFTPLFFNVWFSDIYILFKKIFLPSNNSTETTQKTWHYKRYVGCYILYSANLYAAPHNFAHLHISWFPSLILLLPTLPTFTLTGVVGPVQQEAAETHIDLLNHRNTCCVQTVVLSVEFGAVDFINAAVTDLQRLNKQLIMTYNNSLFFQN